MKIYLDNCCYNRPFDDLSQKIVKEEAQAKLYIQALIKYKKLNLTYSYILLYEISKNPYEFKKQHILDFLENAHEYVGQENKNKIHEISNNIMKSGIKQIDAIHIASAIFSECVYFITTDKRVLKYKNDKIKILNPVDFVKLWEEKLW